MLKLKPLTFICEILENYSAKLKDDNVGFFFCVGCSPGYGQKMCGNRWLIKRFHHFAQVAIHVVIGEIFCIEF